MIGRRLALLTALLPLVAVTVAYLLAARLALVPACNPFLDGCTSISATGRYAPASYVFKPAHLLQALLLGALWLRLAASMPASPAMQRRLRIAGLAGAAALIVYTLTLGTSTPLYEFMRRFGIYIYFIGTLAAQSLASLALFEASRAATAAARNAARWMVALCAAPFVLGSANFVFKAVLADPDPMENRIEWTAALLMQAWFLLLYRYLVLSPEVPTSAGR